MWMAYAAGAMVLYAAGMVTGYLLDRGHRARALFDAQIAGFERRIESNRAPKHAARSPRETPGPDTGPATPSGGTHENHARTARPALAPARRLARDPGGPWYWRHPSPGTPPAAAITAADIAPVFYPAPGTSVPMRPQPARDSGDGTTTMPKITDTGELRAITERADEFIARLQRDGDAYREGLTA